MASKSKIKGITIEIGGDTTKLGKALESVEKSSRSLQSELRGVNTLLKLDPKNTELLRQKQVLLGKAISETEEKQKILNSTLKQIDSNQVNVTEEEYRDLKREIVANEQQLKKLKVQMKDFGSVSKQQLEEIANKVDSVSDKLDSASKKTAALSGTAAAGLIVSAKSAIDFEEAFTGVEKTVDGTTEQLEELKRGIRDLAKEIPASTTEISAVAEAAGQLGIKTEDILKFTKVMIDLGNSTNLSADVAASSLAKFANIMGTSADNYERLGSTIVDLGNNSATTEADIVSMAMRIAGAGKTIGLSEANVLSLSAALSSVGIEAEMGGSAISKTMIKMATAVENGGDNLKEFAKVAGMSTKEFKECFEKDTMTAITRFIIGLGDTEKAGRSTLAMLNDLGFDEVRLRDTMLRAANASDVFTSSIEIGNKAWEENTALVNEANKRYATTKSRMQISINNIKDLSISLGNNLLPNIEKCLKAVNKIVVGFNNLDDRTKKLITTSALLLASISPVLKVGNGITKGVSSLIKLQEKLNSTSGKVIGTLGLLATAVSVGIAIYQKSKKVTNECAIETENLIKKHNELNDTLKNNKSTREKYIKDVEAEAGTADILYKKLVELESIENKTNAQKELMVHLVNDLNELMPELNLQYDKEHDNLNKTTEAIKEQIESQKALIKAKAAMSQLSVIAEDIVKEELAMQEATEQNKKTQEEYQKIVEKRKELEKELTDYSKNGMVGSDSSKKISKELKKIQKEEKDLKKSLDESNKSLKEQKDTLNSLNKEYENTENYATKYFDEAEIKKSIDNVTSFAKKAGIKIPQSLREGMEQGKIIIPKTIDDLKKLISFDDCAKKASEKGIEIPQAIKNGLLSGELDLSETVIRLNQLIDFSSSYQKSIEAGISIPSNIVNGILNGELKIADANTQMNSWVDFQTAILKATEAGINVPKELSDNVLNGKVNVQTATENLNIAISNKLKDLKDVGITAGGDLIDGTAVGIQNEDKQSSVFNTIASFGSKVLNAMRAALDEHSPSKATEKDGENLLLGLANGIHNKRNDVIKEASLFGKEVLTSLNESLEDPLSVNADFNGTRNIMLNSLIGTSSRNLNQNKSSGGYNETNNYNFYSPKALTPSESVRNFRKETQYQKLLHGRR